MVQSGLRRALMSVAAASALAFSATGVAHANYEIGLRAYEQGQYDVAVDIWSRFAVAGDVRSMKALGDVYSGAMLEDAKGAEIPLETGRKLDNVESLRWYSLAAYHRFNEGFQMPTALERNAQILAEERLPEIRFRMSTADVTKAERLVSDTFERGSPYDLYTLGDMYRRGTGVEKNNVRALTMYALAKARGVGAASIAFEELEALMTKKEVDTALETIVGWQPPLPDEHTGQTPQQKELERTKKELEELRLQQALSAIADIDVELIQRALKSLGMYYGSIDNTMGQSTREAIRRFQYSRISSDDTLTEDEKDAVRTGVLTARQTVQLFEAAAREGHPMSQYVYGVMHIRGIGVVQNGDEALNWLSKSAKSDLAIAHYALGVVYRDSTPGLNPVKPDKAKAAIHFARAQSLGYKQAGDALRQLEFEKPRGIDE
ncbi:MAG: peptidoglycan-binding protein [Parvularculaceae bacterium]|nr:peptidoglycan-binding protein [Parvularculaceae bacterium]